MDLGIRFSSPTLDEKDFKLLSEEFELEFNNYEKEGGKEIIENDERKIRRR